MKITVIKNKKAGTGKIFSGEPDIEALFRQFNMNPEIIETPGSGIKDNIISAVKNGSELIVISGGDGTINSAVQVLADMNIPLAIIPSGTLNHFAKDADIPLKVEDAIRIIPEMNIRNVDIGEINGVYFINNSSVGIYPKIVKMRDREIKKTGSGKWTAMGNAIINVFKKLPMIEVKIKSDINKVYCTTPFVFIGNNEYKTGLFSTGIRESLTAGKLSLFYPIWSGRFTLLRFAFHALINRLKEQDDFHVISTEEIKIETTLKKLEVAVDGEVFHMNTPLLYKIHPLALKIVVPADKL